MRKEELREFCGGDFGGNGSRGRNLANFLLGATRFWTFGGPLGAGARVHILSLHVPSPVPNKFSPKNIPGGFSGKFPQKKFRGTFLGGNFWKNVKEKNLGGKLWGVVRRGDVRCGRNGA